MLEKYDTRNVYNGGYGKLLKRYKSNKKPGGKVKLLEAGQRFQDYANVKKGVRWRKNGESPYWYSSTIMLNSGGADCIFALQEGSGLL